MSDDDLNPNADSRLRSLWTEIVRHFGYDEVILIVLMGCAFVGMAITNASTAYGYWYWLAMVPIFCSACIFSEWMHGRGPNFEWGYLLRSQLLHWLGLLAGIQLVYVLLDTGRLDYDSAGYMVAVMLALTAFHSGVHRGGWRFSVVGLFLGLAVFITAFAERYMWLLLLIAMIVIGVSFFIKRKLAAEYGSVRD